MSRRRIGQRRIVSAPNSLSAESSLRRIGRRRNGRAETAAPNRPRRNGRAERSQTAPEPPSKLMQSILLNVDALAGIAKPARASPKGMGRFGAAVSARPIRRGRFGAETIRRCRFGAGRFGARTFRRRPIWREVVSAPFFKNTVIHAYDTVLVDETFLK